VNSADWSLYSPSCDLWETLGYPCAREFLRSFRDDVHNEEIEHLWVAYGIDDDIRIAKNIGSAESVIPPQIPTKGVVFAEVHNHSEIDSPRRMFPHLSDIGACYNNTNRVFAMGAVLLLRHPEQIVAYKFKRRHLREFLDGNASAYNALFRKIRKVHRGKKRRAQHAIDVDRCSSPEEVMNVFEALLPWLEFGTISSSIL